MQQEKDIHERWFFNNNAFFSFNLHFLSFLLECTILEVVRVRGDDVVCVHRYVRSVGGDLNESLEGLMDDAASWPVSPSEVLVKGIQEPQKEVQRISLHTDHELPFTGQSDGLQ